MFTLHYLLVWFRLNFLIHIFSFSFHFLVYILIKYHIPVKLLGPCFKTVWYFFFNIIFLFIFLFIFIIKIYFNFNLFKKKKKKNININLLNILHISFMFIYFLFLLLKISVIKLLQSQILFTLFPKFFLVFHHCTYFTISFYFHIVIWINTITPSIYTSK